MSEAGGWIDFSFLRYRAGSVEGARALFEQCVQQIVALDEQMVQNIRPAPGDWGIDAFVGDITDSITVWQVKYFTENLGAVQRRQVVESFERLIAKAEDEGFSVARWVLCLPIDLSPRETQWWESTIVNEGSQRNIECQLWPATLLSARLLRPEARELRLHFFPGIDAAADAGSARGQPTTLSRLPSTTATAIGRREQLAALSDSWREQNDRVVAVIGWGGVGKSTLVNAWLAELAEQAFDGADRVFAWSFYRQSVAGQVETPDQFFDAAGEWFDVDLSPSLSLWDRAQRLAEAIRSHRTLLILDGCEPLQEPPTSPRRGRFRDPALRLLLKELCAQSAGLCVLTSRLPLPDLAPYRGSTFSEIDLEDLSIESGVELLQTCGVTGRPRELERLVRAAGGHPLTLTLLGNYLRLACGGEAREWRADDITPVDEHLGGHLAAVMAAYAQWFRDQPEEQLLALTALFNRPAPDDQLAVLADTPMIDSLNERLVGLSRIQWNLAIANLAEAGLVTAENLDGQRALDLHPIVREIVGREFMESAPSSVREGHRRLYRYLAEGAAPRPTSITEMLPLFAATFHGVAAGLTKEAASTVYWPRVSQENHFLRDTLGAASANDEVVGYLLKDTGEDDSGLRLSASDRALLLADRSLNLRMLGETAEAIEPLEEAIRCARASGDQSQLANSLRHLAQLQLALGRFDDALASAREATRVAKAPSDPGLEVVACGAVLGDVLHHCDEIPAALEAFEDAHTSLLRGDLNPRRWARRLTLYISLYRHIDLLIDAAQKDPPQRDAHLKRARTICTLGESLCAGDGHDDLSDALMSLARLRIVQGEGATAETEPKHLLDLFRLGGQQPWMIEALLQVSRIRRVAGDLTAASLCAEEARELAEQSGLVIATLDAEAEMALITSRPDEVDSVRERAAAVGYLRLVTELTAQAVGR